MKFFYVFSSFALTNACSVASPQSCTSEATCAGASGIWVPVTSALDLPATAVDGGRRYTLGQSDEEFEKVIAAPNGGYCTSLLRSEVPQPCQDEASECTSLDDCFYRQSGGRWYRSSKSQMCVATCAHPLVYCDKARCGATLGCGWFVKTQSSEDQCFCIENPGIFGNPSPKQKVTWMFWDQPISIPIFVLAVIAALGIAWNVWVFNIKPFFLKVFKKKPKE